MTGPRPLSTAQQAAYNSATLANRTYRDAVDTVHEKYRLMAEQELAGLLETSDRLVRTAVDLGVPKARFRVKGAGLHTTNPYAIDQVLARTERFARAEQQVAEVIAADAGELYRVDDAGHLWITPPGDEVAAIVAQVNANAMTAYEPDTVIPESARFEQTKFGRLNAVDGASIPGTVDRNPVVVWVQRDDNEAAALAWWQARQAA